MGEFRSKRNGEMKIRNWKKDENIKMRIKIPLKVREGRSKNMGLNRLFSFLVFYVLYFSLIIKLDI